MAFLFLFSFAFIQFTTLHFAFVLTLTPAFSDSCFDPSQDSFSFCNSQAVNIAKWREDISGPTGSGQDLLFSAEFQDMHSSDPFELKDTASVYSMDSAYQSQSGASRRGATISEGYSQDSRSRVNNQFLAGDIYSPSLSSDNFSAFPEQNSDMTQLHLGPSTGDLESGDGSFAYANYSTGQDFTQYSTTNVPRFTPTSNIDMGLSWGTADTQYTSPFTFSFPKSSPSMDTTLYSTRDTTDLMFNTPSQRQLNQPRIDTSVRPTNVRSSSSFTKQDSQRASTHDADFGAFVMSPTSAISVHLPQADFDQSQFLDNSNDKEETGSTSVPTQSIDDDDELLSPSDAAEAKTMEEEQSKVARSHPLYQAQPDENGKYHCPNEGKAGCNHKPTPLKCNYDKYVDSHLKPFRCHKKVCVGVQFSSTACLLRHEREAHGMHGHGSRPHLCHFQDCERSLPGNGFPRRYNLFDHMKRVHDYTGPTTEPSPPAIQGQTQGSRKTTTRKRKATSEEGLERRQKVSKPTPQQQLQLRREQLHQSFLSKKQSIIDILTKLSGPSDLRDDIQLTKEVVRLHDISDEFRKSSG